MKNKTSKDKSIFKKGKTYYAVIEGKVVEVKFLRDKKHYVSGMVYDIDYVFEYTEDELVHQVKLNKDVFTDYATARLAVKVENILDRLNKEESMTEAQRFVDRLIKNAENSYTLFGSGLYSFDEEEKKEKTFLQKLFNL